MANEISNQMHPTRDDFAALLSESLAKEDLVEGQVVKGKVVGIGSHHELMESCSTYKEIVHSQLSPEEAA